MNTPLVTVICLCYNHERFVREALDSVFNQTYSNIQVIVVDDASTDGSKEEIKKTIENYSDPLFLPLDKNVGNCKAFNRGLSHATGKYIIDFATDDVMIPDRIEKQVASFEALDPDYGILFSDSIYIDEQGEFLFNHTESLLQKGMIKTVPEDDVFKDVLERYFISSPSMMIRTEVLRLMNGYDEGLVYEDFDLWIRASRNYKFAYLNERLTKVRKSKTSMSAGWYKKGDRQLLSTYKVCVKAKQMIRSESERLALIHRLRYELRQTVFSENKIEADLYFNLLKELTNLTVIDQLLFRINRLSLPVSILRNTYYKLRYR